MLLLSPCQKVDSTRVWFFCLMLKKNVICINQPNVSLNTWESVWHMLRIKEYLLNEWFPMFKFRSFANFPHPMFVIIFLPLLALRILYWSTVFCNLVMIGHNHAIQCVDFCFSVFIWNLPSPLSSTAGRMETFWFGFLRG